MMQNHNQRLVATLVLTIFGFIAITAVWAAEESPMLYQTWSEEQTQSNAPGSEEESNKPIAERITQAKYQSATAIDKRLDDLENLQTEINNLSGIADEDKQYLLDQINQITSALTDLKNSIQAETRTEELGSLVKQIFYDYRVYAVVLPQLRGIKTSSQIGYLIQTKIQPGLQTIDNIINQLKKAGVDTTELAAEKAKLQSYLDQATSELAKAKSNFASMQPAQDYSPALALRDLAVQNLRNSRAYLSSAKESVRTIVKTLKAIQTNLKIN